MIEGVPGQPMTPKSISNEKKILSATCSFK